MIMAILFFVPRINSSFVLFPALRSGGVLGEKTWFIYRYF
jgi:hypothetical protein